MSAFTHLLAPLNRGPLALKNRLVMMATVNNLGTNTEITAAQIAYYRERARGGVAAIVTEGLAVHPTSIPNPTVPLAYREELLPDLRRLADAVHADGARLFGQLWHVGRNALWNPTLVPWSPSPERDPFSGSTPHAMTGDEIRSVVAGFVDTAARLQRAGFDGVEVHGAHGYLITQFLSPWSNRREDAYGGSVEHRARIVREIIDGIRATCGAGFVVGLKLSIHEYVAGGLTLEDSQAIVAHLVELSPPDYLGVSQSNFSPSLERHVPDMRFEPAPFVELARGIRGAARDVPILFMGRVVGAEHAESILAEGSADLIGMARGLIADAHLIRKVASGQPERVRPCIFCNVCWEAIHTMRPVACIYGPEVGREAEWGEGTLQPAEAPREVRIVGAGPAGLEAARVAAARGHRVHLYEQADRPGGQAALGTIVPGREEYARVAHYLADEAVAAGATIHLRQTVGPDLVERWVRQGEAVIVATGSLPDPPVLPGAVRVETLESALSRPDWSGTSVALVDELEDEPVYAAAEALAARGARVHLVTRRPQLGRRLAFVSLIGALRRLDLAGVSVHPFKLPVRLEGVSLVLRHVFSGREEPLAPVDVVVYAGPYRARDDLARTAGAPGADLRIIGDAYAPRRALVAVLDGHRAGREV